MDEYWNQFLNWLSSLYRDQSPKIAPRVEDRYAESYRVLPWDDKGTTKSGVILRKRSGRRQAWILRAIRDNDTIYSEMPDSRYGFANSNSKSVSNKDSNRLDYEQLLNRYNRAWNIAADMDINNVKYNRIGAYLQQAPTVGNLFNQFLEFLDIPTK